MSARRQSVRFFAFGPHRGKRRHDDALLVLVGSKTNHLRKMGNKKTREKDVLRELLLKMCRGVDLDDVLRSWFEKRLKTSFSFSPGAAIFPLRSLPSVPLSFRRVAFLPSLLISFGALKLASTLSTSSLRRLLQNHASLPSLASPSLPLALSLTLPRFNFLPNHFRPPPHLVPPSTFNQPPCASSVPSRFFSSRFSRSPLSLLFTRRLRLTCCE